MDTKRLDAIHHVAIQVADIERAVNWYTTSFECSVGYIDKTEALLEFANISLALVLPSKHPPHVAFQRRDAASFGELREQSDGTRSCLLADPTGNLIEILEWTGPTR